MLDYLRKLREAIEKLITRLFLHPFFGFLTSVVGIIAGWLGSHFDKEISRAEFGLTLKLSEVDWNVLAFWAATLCFGIFFSGTFWAQSASAAKSNADLHEAIDKLRTVPPKGFLKFYQDLAVLSMNIRWNLPSTTTAAQIEHAIRLQLDFMAKMVEKFDDHGGNVFYGANVMTYVPVGSAQFTANQSSYAAHIKCIESGVPVTALNGVLDLQTKLSVTNVPGQSPDPNLSSLCLPLTNQGLADPAWLIAGAPLAYATEDVLVYESQEELFTHVNASPNFTPKVKNELKAILNNQADYVQALICIPLYDKAQTTVIGVLNIHKNIADKFIAEKIALLIPLLDPMVKNLGNLVDELS